MISIGAKIYKTFTLKSISEWIRTNDQWTLSPSTIHYLPFTNSFSNDILSDPRGILTLDLQNRNLTLYTAKLWGLMRKVFAKLTEKMNI